jgi:multicomponent Na+:H+ antiporter subunit D
VAVPLGAAFVIPLLSRIWRGIADLVANVAGAVLLGLSAVGLAYLLTGSGGLVYRMGGWPSAFGIALAYDSLTALVLLALNVVGFCALLYSPRYVDLQSGRWKFYTLFMLVIAGLNGVAVSGDLFNLFVFIEIAAVSSYALVAFGAESEQFEAGFKYMVIGEIGSLFVLLAIALVYSRVSALNMAVIGRSMAAIGHTPLFWFIVATFLVGFAIKAAAVPFHSWLLDAHPSAPAPVSALLSGAFIKVAGVYALSRVMFCVLGLSRGSAPHFFNLLVGLGVLSAGLGVLGALSQTDSKRLLAYSSVSQMGFILIGLGIGNWWGVAGALFHVLAHALGKGVLFLSVGSFERATGERELGSLRGLERSMPWSSWSYLLGAFSLAGLPPLGGFFSKALLILGAISARMYWLAAVTAAVSVVTAGYFLRFINACILARQDAEPTRAAESPATMVLAMAVLVALSLALGVGFKPVLDGVVGPAADVLLDGAAYVRMVLGG